MKNLSAKSFTEDIWTSEKSGLRSTNKKCVLRDCRMQNIHHAVLSICRISYRHDISKMATFCYTVSQRYESWFARKCVGFVAIKPFLSNPSYDALSRIMNCFLCRVLCVSHIFFKLNLIHYVSPQLFSLFIKRFHFRNVNLKKFNSSNKKWSLDFTKISSNLHHKKRLIFSLLIKIDCTIFDIIKFQNVYVIDTVKVLRKLF